MFNTTRVVCGDTNIKVNAVSGTMVKNYQESFFIRFQKGSEMEKLVFDEKPCLNSDNFGRRNTPIVVVQAMILADNHYLCEIMHKKDFDNMFNCESEV